MHTTMCVHHESLHDGSMFFTFLFVSIFLVFVPCFNAFGMLIYDVTCALGAATNRDAIADLAKATGAAAKATGLRGRIAGAAGVARLGLARARNFAGTGGRIFGAGATGARRSAGGGGGSSSVGGGEDLAGFQMHGEVSLGFGQTGVA